VESALTAAGGAGAVIRDVQQGPELAQELNVWRV
jgi:hypothetical protein